MSGGRPRTPPQSRTSRASSRYPSTFQKGKGEGSMFSQCHSYNLDHSAEISAVLGWTSRLTETRLWSTILLTLPSSGTRWATSNLAWWRVGQMEHTEYNTHTDNHHLLYIDLKVGIWWLVPFLLTAAPISTSSTKPSRPGFHLRSDTFETIKTIFWYHSFPLSNITRLQYSNDDCIKRLQTVSIILMLT